jgi:2-haloacid dehalogenase
MKSINRRTFHLQMIGLASTAAITAAPGRLRGNIRAITFDAFPILDPRPLAEAAEELFPGQGTSLINVWRDRQFEYTWLRTLSKQYADFWTVTGDALRFAAKTLHVGMTSQARDLLMGAYLKLRCWPDVPDALADLRRAGIRTALLSNMTDAMLKAGLANSKLESQVDYILSTDRVRAYKPDPRAYRMGMDSFRLKKEQILFVASAGWDAAGAKAFGYPTFWVNRMSAETEELNVRSDASGKDLRELVSYLLR